MLRGFATRLRGVGLALLPLAVLGIGGCAVKPDEKVAHGEDQGLVAKSDLLARPLAEVAAADMQLGLETAVGSLPASVQPLLATLDGALLKAPTTQVSFDVGETYLTVNVATPTTALKPMLQFKIKGHYDLKPQTTADGVETQYLVKDAAANVRWQDREYVEVDALDPLKIKADDDLLTYLYPVESVDGKELVFNSTADLIWLTPSDRAELVKLFALKAGDKLKTTLSRTHFTLLKIDADGALILLAQAPVTYVDLVRDETDKGELTPELKRDQTKRDWSERTYVEINADVVKLSKPAADLMEHVYAKAALAGHEFVYGKTLIPLLDETPDLATQLMKVETVKVKIGDKIQLRVTRNHVDVLVGGVLALQYPVLAHYDVVNAKDEDGEKTSTLVLDAVTRPWADRLYVKVDPEMVEPARRSQELRDAVHQMTKKEALAGCFEVASLPLKALRDAATVALAAAATDEKVCVDVTQTVLSLSTASGKLLTTFDINCHCDIKQVADLDGEVSAGLVRDTSNPDWQERQYVEIDINAHPVETYVRPNPIKKSSLSGEFIYTATVVAAHSENGLLPEGYNLQSTDRLKFEFGEDTLTAYKVNETLNQSTAKSPVLRYSLAHFDIERQKNGYGDRTHVIAESTDKPWQSRAYVGVDLVSNQIPSYFNDLLGLDKYYFGAVLSGRSVMVGDIEITDDLISFVTEEVVTPNVLAGFSGAGETRYEPMAIKIKHSFMKVGKRDYVAQEYDRFDFTRFGYFRATEFGLDAERGKTDETLKHFIRRFDISDGKQIHYYLSAGFPEKFKDEAQEVIAAWNVAFKAATGRDDVIVLHDEATSDHGDPRLNMLVWIDGYNVAAPLGYGPSFFDPLTGENLSAKAYIYGDGVRSVVTAAGDYYDLASGARPAEDFMTGDSLQPVSSTPEPVVEDTTVAGRAAVVSARRTPAVASATRLNPPRNQHPLVKALPSRSELAKAMVRAVPKASPLKALDALKRVAQSPTLAPETAKGENAKLLDAFSQQMQERLSTGSVASLADRHQGCLMDPETHIASAIKFVEAYQGKTKAEVMAELESRLVFTTLLHEVGHNLGLRHNFQGSFDEPNFPTEYHLLKLLKDMGEPDPIAPGEWVFKYRTSSIMDYNDDFEALNKAAGPYDVAAIKYGYGDKLEQVVGVDDTGAMVTEDISKAALTAKKAALKAANPGASEVTIDLMAQSELQLRPYRFCTDEHVENDPTCNRFDRGVTVTEITQSLVEDYETVYQLHGFRRGRREFRGGTSYVLTRYVLPVRQLVDEYIYNLIFNAFPNQDAPDGSPLPASPSDYIGAINLGIDFFEKILKTLEPGVYHLDEASGELLQGRSDTPEAKNVVVPLPAGKYLEARTEIVGGEERVLSRGVEFDKIAVLFAMSMRGFPAEKYERASMSLNFFDLLKQFTLETFSAVMRDELSLDLVAVKPEGAADFQAVIGQTAAPTDPTDPNQLKAKIKPSTSLSIKQMASVFAMSNYSTSADRTFGDYVNFRLKGVDDLLPAGVQALEFTSASGLKTYVVPNTADKLSISYKIAEKAAPLAASLAAAKLAVATAPDLTQVKLEVIELFGQAWAIGEGAPMGDNIVDILMGNFDRNLAAVRGLTAEWLEKVEDPAQKEQLQQLAELIEAKLVVYETQSQETQTLTDSIESMQRDLVRYESDLLFLHDLNAVFGSL